MNLCIDCRWFLQPPNGISAEYAECGHPSAELPRPPSVVTGEPLDLLRQDCTRHRQLTGLTRDDPCGPDGKYWEAAEPRGFA
jgi:hypothetical protein